MAVETMQFLVQDVEAEEAHFGNCDSLFNLIAIRVGMAIGVLVLVLVRGMSVLEWEELSACHRLGIWLFLSTFSLFQNADFHFELLTPTSTTLVTTKRATDLASLYWIEFARLDFGIPPEELLFSHLFIFRIVHQNSRKGIRLWLKSPPEPDDCLVFSLKTWSFLQRYESMRHSCLRIIRKHWNS